LKNQCKWGHPIVLLIAGGIETVLLDVLDLLIEAAYSKKKSTPHIKNPELFSSVFTLAV
jgi:hypothetical protein